MTCFHVREEERDYINGQDYSVQTTELNMEYEIGYHMVPWSAWMES